MTTIAVKNLDTPDQKHGFENGDLNLVSPPGMTIARAVFQPGWRWSIDVKPAAGTDSCPAAHTGYVISGRFAVRMDDGTEAEFGPGDAHVVSPGHDAWVVGTEPCVIIDVAPAPQQQPGTAGSDGARMALCPCGIEFRPHATRPMSWSPQSSSTPAAHTGMTCPASTSWPNWSQPDTLDP